MATAIVTNDQDAVTSEVLIAAPPWVSDHCQIENFSIDRKAGGRYIHDTLRTNGSKLHCEGEVLEYDPPHRLSYTWIADWHEDRSRRTVVLWELEPHAGGTRVTVTHSGLAQEPTARKEYNNGWPNVAEKLKAFVERSN